MHKLISTTSIAILALAGTSGCDERIPPANTAAFFELHGVINDGKTVNEITLVNDRNENHPKLRFPPQISVGVYTPDTHNPISKNIRKGFAYDADVTLELNKQKQLVPIVRTPDHLVYDTVEIRFHASLGQENAEMAEARLQEIARQSARTTDKAEWGLTEYTPTIAGDLQSFTYVPFDKNFKSIDGTRMWIGCHVGGAKITNNQGPASCANHFNYKNGLSVTYLFDARLLPYWREIYQEVVKFADHVLVN